MSKQTTKFHAMIYEIAEKIESCEHIFELPWHQIDTGAWPVNATTGRTYQGINLLSLLWKQDKLSQNGVWATYRQWQSIDRQVRKGSRSHMIKWASQVPVKDGEEDETVTIWKYSYAFNETQLEDYTTPNTDAEIPAFDEVKEQLVSDFIDNIGVVIVQGQMAFYTPSTDTITIPHKDAFKTTSDGMDGAVNYYATLLHEVGHNCIAKVMPERCQNLPYAFEEIVVDLFSCIVGNELGVQPAIRENHVAYIKGWAKDIKDDPNYLMNAASIATKLFKFVMEKQTKDVLQRISQAKPAPGLTDAKSAAA